MLPIDITDFTDEEILKIIHETMGHRYEGGVLGFDELYKHYMNVLELRSMRRAAQASERLVWATWLLFFATLLLLVGVIPQLFAFIGWMRTP